MNHADNLLKIDFFSLSHNEQMQIKQLGPHQPRQFEHQQTDKAQSRSFSSLWFDKIEWLTVSLTTKRFFCFYCLLFGGSDTPWSSTGYRDLKHLSERTKKHESSTMHINNAVRFKTLGTLKKPGETLAVSIYAHNEMARKNRHALDRVINCVRFCAGHQLDLHGEGPSAFLDLVEYVTNLDHALHGHALSNASTKPASKAIVDELLDCMYHVYQDDVRRSIKSANFVSLQVDETSDVSNQVQLALTARFLTDSATIAERFLTFLELGEKSHVSAADLVKNQLKTHHIGMAKLIAQSHNSAALIDDDQGQGIHAQLQVPYPNAHLVPSYAHDLADTLQRACASRIPPIKLFCVNLSGFAGFFSSARPCALLQAERNKNRDDTNSSWNFQNGITSSVYENQVEIAACLEKIQGESGWDEGVVREAVRLEGLLNDAEFFFFLDFFYCVLQHVDALLSPQEPDRVQTFDEFEVEMSAVLDSIEMASGEGEDGGPPPGKRSKTAQRQVAADACDLIVNLVRQVFVASEYTAAFAVVDPRQFGKFRQVFPNDLVQVLVGGIPRLAKTKLANELGVLYSIEKFAAATGVCDLLKLLANSQLLSTFTQVSKLLEIVLTTPVATDETERCFDTLKRTRGFLKNAKRRDHLNALGVLAVHRDVIESIPGFNNMVIDRFATEKHRVEYLFK